MPEFPLAAHAFATAWGAGAQPGLGVGMDMVVIDRIREALTRFGDRFVRRIFTEHEAAYAGENTALQAERLAARFAAKEAALKALAMADQGIAWQDMEVWRHPDGRCDLRLHGKAAAHAQGLGVRELALSLTHDGHHAAAIVAAVMHKPPAARPG